MRGVRGNVLLVLLVVAALGVSGFALKHQPAPPAFTPPSGYQFGAPPSERPNALIVGDSYTAGTGARTPSEGLGQLTARQMGWVADMDAEGGTGFVTAATPATKPYPDRLASDRQFRADYVLVTGGRNDAPAATAPAAAADYLRLARRTYPKAKLIVVAPFWSDSNPPAGLLAIRDSEALTARSLDATFIDPLRERWITDENAGRYIGPDGIHPTPDGHQYLAGRIVAALKQAGVAGQPTMQ